MWIPIRFITVGLGLLGLVYPLQQGSAFVIRSKQAGIRPTIMSRRQKPISKAHHQPPPFIFYARNINNKHPYPTTQALDTLDVSTELFSRSLYSAVGDSEEEGGGEEEEPAKNEVSILGRIKNYFFKKKEDDGLTFKQRLAKMGFATVLSYGMISNLSYGILIALSWYGFSVKVSSRRLFSSSMIVF
jgi:hypothetical protein